MLHVSVTRRLEEIHHFDFELTPIKGQQMSQTGNLVVRCNSLAARLNQTDKLAACYGSVVQARWRRVKLDMVT